MWQDLLTLAGVIAGCVLGTAIGVRLMSRPRRRSRKGGAALVSAIFFAFGDVFTGQDQEKMIHTARDEARRRKDAKSGDPPDPFRDQR